MLARALQYVNTYWDVFFPVFEFKIYSWICFMWLQIQPGPLQWLQTIGISGLILPISFSFLYISETFHLAMQMIFDHVSYFGFCSENHVGESLEVILNHYL